jgi:serine/threonine protein kinase
VIRRDGEVVSDTKFYLVSEHCEHGEAFDFVIAGHEAKLIDDKYARGLFLQILDGVDHIHKHGIAHRDLKLENVFLDANFTPKVADFGLSKIFKGKNASPLKTLLGTSYYIAPEQYCQEGKAYKGSPVDMFALGHILYIIRMGSMAFHKSVDDPHYKKLQQNPDEFYNTFMQNKNIDFSFLSLVRGMTN